MNSKNDIEDSKLNDSSLPPDEYTTLLEQFARVAEGGKDAYQEAAGTGRELNYVGLAMDSRTAVICKTSERGIPEFVVTGTETDNKGNRLRQRTFIGAASEAATFGRSDKSADLAHDKTVVNEFEVGSQAYDLVKAAVEEAQPRGEEINRKVLEEAFPFKSARARSGQETIVNLDTEPQLNLNVIRDLVALGWEEIQRGLGAKIRSAQVVFSKWAEHYIYADSEGARVSVVVPRVSFIIYVKTKKGSEAFGARRGAYGTVEQIFTRGEDFQGKSLTDCVKILSSKICKEAIDLDRAQTMSILGNEFYVILGPEAAGVLAHEVYGHTSEGDIICEVARDKNAKVNLRGRLGAQVSSHTAFRIIDTGLPEADLGGEHKVRFGFGSLAVDNRGDPPQEVPLVEKGTMVGALMDRYSFNYVVDGIPAAVRALIEARGLTGSARREKYDKPCIVRMRNTYIASDPNGPDEIKKMAGMIPGNKKGIYITTCMGGWVEPKSGEFQITGNLGYLIENGVVTDKPVKGVILRDNITSFGDKIAALGAADTMTGIFTGFCGKDGQWVPVEGCGPLMLIKDMKAISLYNPRPWMKLIEDYQTQFDQVVEGKRRRENVYFPEIAESVDEGPTTSQSSLCVSTALLSTPILEILWILGLNSHPDFVSVDGDGGRHLSQRSDAYDS